MSCYCDFDTPAAFVHVNTWTARKKHKCCECGHVIVPGETYERVTGKWDYGIDTFKTCEKCVDLRDALADYNGGCFQYRGLNEAYWAYLNELPLREGLDTHALHAEVFAKHRRGD